MKIDRRALASSIVLGLGSLMLGGCFVLSDDERAAKPWVTPRDAGTLFWPTEPAAAADAAVPEPFTMELTQLMPQPVRWASVDVSVIGARQVRGISSNDELTDWFGDPLPRVLVPSRIYVELDLKVANKSDEETWFEDRGTWDLLLADGRRLQSADLLTVQVLPGDETTASLHYEVDQVVALQGAKLQLNGDERGALEPELIPLDAAYVQEFPRRIPALIGRTVEARSKTMHIDEAVYDVNCQRTSRASAGKRFVWMDVAITSVDDAYVVIDDMRIVVDGRASAPVMDEHESVAAGATRVLSVAFEVDAAATQFDIVIPTGDETSARFPVDVADTVLTPDL